MLKDLKNSVRSLWREDPAGLTQRVIDLALGLGTAALLIVTSVNIASQLAAFVA